MNTMNILRSALAALLVAGTSSVALADATATGSAPARASLEGTYRVTITPYVCSTGQPVPNVRFHSFLSFSRGGTLLETTSNALFEPAQRSAGFAYWERTGSNSYHAVTGAWILFDSTLSSRYRRGLQRIEQGIELRDANHWSSEATVTFFDEGGTIVPPTGCMRAVGERME